MVNLKICLTFNLSFHSICIMVSKNSLKIGKQVATTANSLPETTHFPPPDHFSTCSVSDMPHVQMWWSYEMTLSHFSIWQIQLKNRNTWMREQTKIKYLGRRLNESLGNENYQMCLGIKRKTPFASKERDLMRNHSQQLRQK